MSVSQETKFVLEGGKDEVTIKWDASNGAIEFHRSKIGSKKSDKFVIRAKDLDSICAREMLENIVKAFDVMFDLNQANIISEFDLPMGLNPDDDERFGDNNDRY